MNGRADTTEDQLDRVPGDVLGDHSGLPINDAARRYAETWDVSRVSVLEHQCQPYNVAHIYRGPLQFRIWEDKDPGTQEVIAYQIFIGTYMQNRTIWMDGRPHPPNIRVLAWLQFQQVACGMIPYMALTTLKLVLLQLMA